MPLTEHFAYFSFKNFLGSTSEVSVLYVDERDGELVSGGMGGIFVEVGDGEEPLRPALRFCWLFVFVRPNPCRLRKFMFVSY